MRKRIFTLFLAMAMVLGAGIYADNAMATENIKVIVNSTQVQFDVTPKIINNRTMVPMRAIFESLGATVEYAPATKTITAKRNGEVVICTIGNRNMTVNGNVKTMDVSPVAISGRTLVPARFIAEAFACDVQWNEQSKTVTITSGKQGGTTTTNVNCYVGTDILDYGKFSNSTRLDKSGPLGTGLRGNYYIYDEPKQSYDNDWRYFADLSDGSPFWDYVLALGENGYDLNDIFGRDNGLLTIELENGKNLVQVMTDTYVCTPSETPEVIVQYTDWKGYSTFNNDDMLPCYEGTTIPDLESWVGNSYFDYFSNNDGYLYNYDISNLKIDSNEAYYNPYNGLSLSRFMMMNGYYLDFDALIDNPDTTVFISLLTEEEVGIQFHDSEMYVMILSE